MLAATCPAAADDASARIIGGTPSESRSYAVAMQFDRHGEKDFHYCGGTLISSDVVLTAAHCVDARLGAPPIDQVHVRVGHRDQAQGFYARAVATATTGFSISPPGRDIALIKLDRRVPHRPALVGTSPGKTGIALTAIGWGRTRPDNTGPSSRILMQANVSVLPTAECKPGLIGTAEVCAQGIHGQGVCAGDSGTGLLRSYGHGRFEAVVGLASRGTGGGKCGTAPDIHTDVTKYLRWIYTTAARMGAQAPLDEDDVTRLTAVS
ncbi:serine protease [Allokutzneria sp. A3M-2-11 16]|uniref:S1 family peptidase n=1 Tax=Allokutzneria sp. A3M-2-11 16 TaxID=2962043 RepID=UPI0020B703AC|nr:serine protease [Allokutzneria sp. A3M-2-11 16]MCP3801871.1 serine protease [Allokutzneria sp. A3M-2-11 16]